ncbi:MAG: hypothetical protein B6D59_05275 [Campylobacteraceae bacterium 4484_4]|nr:MAG: hypothetical protein B6D59_05275 [Campylobacteraceae bacterium 4484_4]
MAEMTPTMNTALNPTKPNDNIAVNPKSILGKDDFLKLLLTELSYQDPTSPMDTEKILTQTSQLATLETQQNTNKVMTELANRFKMEQSMSAISAIGRTARLSNEIEGNQIHKTVSTSILPKRSNRVRYRSKTTRAMLSERSDSIQNRLVSTPLHGMAKTEKAKRSKRVNTVSRPAISLRITDPTKSPTALTK